MKNVLMIVLGVVVVGVGGLLAVAAMQPDTMHVERSLTVAATPADVFPFANDFEKWQQWNPWRDMDPSQKETFSDQKVGAGAWYTWEGNEQVGKGRMEIRESVQDQKVVEDLHFIEPFESKAVVTFSMAAAGEQTKVTWAMDSEQNLMSKAFGLFMDMDTMIGADFERGLGKLKPLAEGAAKDRIAAAEAAAAAALAAAGTVPAEGEALPGTVPVEGADAVK